MNPFRRIPHLVRFLIAGAGALLGLAVLAPPAFALRVPASGGFPTGVPVAPHAPLPHSLVASGMAGWQITAIVAVVAVLAAAVAIVVDRARAAHRTGMVPAT
jgi:hypothetical protein